MLISRRREAKRRALLQMLDRIPVRTGTRTSAQTPNPRTVVPLPVDAPRAARAPLSEGLPRVKQ